MTRAMFLVAWTMVFLAPQVVQAREFVLLQCLDKVTARTYSITARLNNPFYFGSLQIEVKKCVKSPPEEPPENAVFLEIRELREGSTQRLFNGWMFSSSPALSALEHPVYDIWVVDCRTRSSAS